jgi:hypothetical protein
VFSSGDFYHTYAGNSAFSFVTAATWASEVFVHDTVLLASA